jgi:hypothetical protein
LDLWFLKSFRNNERNFNFELINNKYRYNLTPRVFNFFNFSNLQRNFCIKWFSHYRKWGWFRTNFSFDARLRRCRVLYYTAIGGSFLILIWTSFSSFILGTYFCITLLFMHKTSNFLVSDFAGDLGQRCFWAKWKILMKDFLLIIFNNIIYPIYINLEPFTELQSLKFAINFL